MDLDLLKSMLDEHKVLTLAYTDKDGIGACGLWFANDDDLNIYFLSSLTTRHGKALDNGTDVAFTIHKDEQNWQSITGIQGTGSVEMISAGKKAWNIYANKFPFILKEFEDLDDALQQTKLWKLRPSWIRRIDNRIKFGYKEEMILRDT